MSDKIPIVKIRWNGWFKAIVASIIAAILYKFILDPFLSYSFGAIISETSRYKGEFINRVFESAAQYHDIKWIWAILYLILYTVTIIVSVYVFTRISGLVFYNKDIKDKSNNEKKDELIPRNFVIFYTAAHLILVLFVLVGFLFISIKGNALASIVSVHEHRMTILRPVIDHQTEEELSAEWVQMVSKGDYLAIVAKMNKLAADANIKLPEPKSNL